MALICGYPPANDVGCPQPSGMGCEPLAVTRQARPTINELKALRASLTWWRLQLSDPFSKCSNSQNPKRLTRAAANVACRGSPSAAVSDPDTG
jgi:hypothetical protein